MFGNTHNSMYTQETSPRVQGEVGTVGKDREGKGERYKCTERGNVFFST